MKRFTSFTRLLRGLYPTTLWGMIVLSASIPPAGGLVFAQIEEYGEPLVGYIAIGVLLGAVAGTSTGALIGGVAGTMSHAWRLCYPIRSGLDSQ